MPTDPPHILQVCAGEAATGAAFARRIDRALQLAAARAGLRLTTTLLRPDPPSPEGGPDPWSRPGWVADALLAWLRPADAVYVHGCLSPAGLFVAAHARLLGKRVIGCDDGGAASPLLAANPEAATVYDAVHAPSAFAAAACADLPVPVHVIEGPIDCELFRPRPDGPPRDPRLVVALGPVLPRHGQERIVRALPPGLSLVLLGAPVDPAHAAVLREAIRQRLAPADAPSLDAPPPGAALPVGGPPVALPSRGGRARASRALAGSGVGRDARAPVTNGARQDRAGGVSFVDAADGPALRDLLARAGTVVQASTHLDHAGRFVRAPEWLGTAALEALASGAPTLVSDAGCLPELATLPGCRVFRTDAELAALLHRVAADAGREPVTGRAHGSRAQARRAEQESAHGRGAQVGDAQAGGAQARGTQAGGTQIGGTQAGGALAASVAADPATGRTAAAAELARHAAVAARCGLPAAGGRLLALLGVGPACAS